MRVTQKQHISTCLEAFQAKVEKSFEHHIEWAENAYRYQSVVNLVYAELVMRVMSKPEMIKLTNALNRQTEHALSVLHARGQLIDANQTSLTVQVTGSDASVHESTGQSHVTLDNVQDAQPPQDCAAGNVAETRKCEAAKEAQSVAHAASETSDPTREVEPSQAAILGEPEPPNLADATNVDDAANHPQGQRMGVSDEVARSSVTGVNRT
jgi:acetolactate synthase small subunit